MRNLFYALLFTKALHGKINPIKLKKTMKKDGKFLIELIYDIVQVVNVVLSFIFSSLGMVIKKVCQRKTVKSIDENSCNDKIINLTEYKSKKAK